MKHPFRFSILPYFTLGAGGLGLVLRLWLFSAVDSKNLLPVNHPADPLLYILSAVVLGILFLATRIPKPLPGGKKVHRILCGICYVVAAAALLFTGCSGFFTSTGILETLASAAYLVGAAAALVMAALTYYKKRLPFGLMAVFTAVLMLTTISLCRKWGIEPQLQVYFFPLMASVFTVLSAYQRTALTIRAGKLHLFTFFNQSALFFCLVSCLSANRLVYFGLACWTMAQFYCKQKEA